MRFGVIILAAGQSSRMGGAHKLLADIGGKPMIAHVAATAHALNAQAVIMVTGREAEAVASACDGFDLEIVHNPTFRDGLSTSLKVGVAALPEGGPEGVPEGLAGVLVLLGDMPLITPEECMLLLQMAEKHQDDVVRAAHEGQAGNPVFLPSSLFAPIASLTGDQGAMPLIKKMSIKTHWVEIGESALLDADTPEALAVLRQRFSERA